MSGEAFVIGLVTWGGGLITWVVAAVFEYAVDYLRYKEKRAETNAAVQHDREFAATIGDVEAYLETLGAGNPSIINSIFRTALQPLLVLAIIIIPTFRVLKFGGWVAVCVSAFAMVLVLCLTVLHELRAKSDAIESKSYHAVIIGAWAAYAFLILWLAHCSIDEK